MAVVGKFFTVILLILITSRLAVAQEKLPVEHLPDSLNMAINQPDKKDSDYIIVRKIIITGNKKTHDLIILRNLGIQPGDTLYLYNAMSVLEERRQQLLNTSLFLTVNIYFKHWVHGYTDIEVDVFERLYTLVVPIFSLADRNFNVWWVEKHHSLSRINFGINIYRNNFTGKNDQLKSTIQLGYTRRFFLQYKLPYFDKKLRNGLEISTDFSQSREVNYAIINNKQAFYKQDGFLRKQFSLGLNYTRKKAIRFNNNFGFRYYFQTVGDTVLALNPHFFTSRQSTQRFFELSYKFSYIGTDSWNYPLRGYEADGALVHRGFGILDNINFTLLHFNTKKYWQLFRKTYADLGFRGQIYLPEDQPYFQSHGMGFGGDYLRGLEYYVIDGFTFGMFQSDLKQQLFNFKLSSHLLPKKIGTIPIRIYAKVFGDMGYVENHHPGTSSLNNKLLYTGGIGVDIVTYYDLKIRVEYSLNQLGEKGLFLHAQSTF